jgi:GDP-L-fucose synthase
MARLILWSLENWKNEKPCMIINEEEVSVMQVANIIKDKLEIDEKDLFFDITKPKGQIRKPAKSDVTDFKFKPITEGINETIDWFIKNYQQARK